MPADALNETLRSPAAPPLADHNLRPPEERPSWTKSRAGLRLSVWKERYDALPRKPEDWSIYSLYSTREIFFTIIAEQDDDPFVAAGHFEEWRQNFPPEGSDVDWPCVDYFRVVAEALSREAADMSEIVFRMWGGADEYSSENFFNYGNLLIFERLRINAASKAQSVAAWLLIGDLIKRLAMGSRHRAALMILKAFPLEFENGDPDTSKAKARQRAMQRLYRARLGAEALPGRHYREWMWCALRYGPKPPKFTRRKDPTD